MHTRSNTWLRQPQTIWLRKAAFQVHLWLGIGLGLYIVVLFLSGSVLVYRNELYGAFLPAPGGPTPFGYRATTWLLDLHGNLLAGESGRHINAWLSALVGVLALTGIVIWWPGIQRWRRSLMIEMRANWRKFSWSLHSALGIWFAGFILMWAVTGLYLGNPEPFGAFIDYLEPPDETNPVERGGDRVLFWLAYAHFGRFGGRLPGCARGAACDEFLKVLWAGIGLVPIVMFVTGLVMWWNRSRYGAARWRTR
jgi:uncharacterized iron-regulated membrane protein